MASGIVVMAPERSPVVAVFGLVDVKELGG